MRNLSDDSDSDDYNTFRITVHSVKQNKMKHLLFRVEINGTEPTMMADSGSSISILDEQDYYKMKARPSLEDTNVKIYPYNSKSQLPVRGKVKTRIKTTIGATSDEEVYVVEGSSGSLLSWCASQRLDLITATKSLRSLDASTEVDRLAEEYSDLFSGLGKLKNYQVKLHIDKDLPPVAQPHRRVPFHVRKQLEEQLNKDEELGVIEKVEGPTSWVSPVVVAPKPKQSGKIRVYADMRQANQALKRERHLTPTVKEVIGDLNGAKVFSKLDLNQGYNQLELAPESRYIATFSTHLGLRRYTRLNFGISSAAEIFQNAICETLSGIEGAINLSDDILVYGKTQEEHDKSLKATFQRLRESGLTLHKQKCVYGKDKLELFGYPKKVEEILNLDAPSNASDVRSLLGMTNYCSQFIQSYATVPQPLRELTQKERTWEWTARHDQALAQLKGALANAPVTAYFDPNKDTEICVDARPVGLGAILAQTDPDNGNQQVVAYASRSLSDTEQRYSQTEREALAVVWGANTSTYICTAN